MGVVIPPFFICSPDSVDSYRLSIKNDGEAPKTEIELHGGLKNLNSEVTAAGGSMEIVYSPDFALEITLPKGGYYAV